MWEIKTPNYQNAAIAAVKDDSLVENLQEQIAQLSLQIGELNRKRFPNRRQFRPRSRSSSRVRQSTTSNTILRQKAHLFSPKLGDCQQKNSNNRNGITGRIRKTKFPSLIDDQGTWGRAESSLRKRQGIDHPIPYRYGGSTNSNSSAKKELEFMLQMGLCRPSKSNWSSPLHLVAKKSGDWRPCGDYRSLNNVTIPDRYPLPFLTDCSYILAGTTVFTSLDLVRAYQQIPVHEEDIEFPFMTFRLHNAAQTFSRFMREVLSGLDFVFCYLDNILIASADERTHLQHLRAVLQRLNEYELCINAAKCKFGQAKIVFLGYEVLAGDLKPLASTVDGITNFPEPKSYTNLRKFLGMVNFYHRFIPNCAKIQQPLTSLLSGIKEGSKKEVIWTEESKNAFQLLKEALGQAANLTHPSEKNEISLTTDASDTAIGAVLHQTENQK
ncbi:hypothetical protein JTE90_023599 [Oedothorax gibbosus]|uniref:Reverse transcriptase domain-containing protein n=1 Tax=Oedothorax gibbosus TaxID=931172 RepID=A0AAV6UF03_9ARAC|nr:hypothetical protein JTE90_023599 [Oedothorax gibbosus]